MHWVFIWSDNVVQVTLHLSYIVRFDLQDVLAVCTPFNTWEMKNLSIEYLASLHSLNLSLRGIAVLKIFFFDPYVPLCIILSF